MHVTYEYEMFVDPIFGDLKANCLTSSSCCFAVWLGNLDYSNPQNIEQLFILF